MRAGELAAKMRVSPGFVERSHLAMMHWDLILAALDVAEVERAIKNMHITDDAFFALCDTRIAAYEALRRAEEGP